MKYTLLLILIFFLNSIKAAERKTRKENWTILITSIKSKAPADFQSF